MKVNLSQVPDKSIHKAENLTPKVNYVSHLIIPCAMFLMIALVFEIFQLDIYLADWIYRLENYSWHFKNSFWLDGVLHNGGRNAVVIVALILLARIIISMCKHQAEKWKPMLVLFVSVLITVILVSLLKQLTHVACPWNILRYGGSDIYTPIFEQLPSASVKRACFPAGHASAGYAWVALYYYFLVTNPKLKWLALGFALGLGVIFDVTQQIRGAHFFSHGIWTLAISWFVATATYFLSTRNIFNRVKDKTKEH